MKSFDAAMPARRLQSFTTGMNMATTGVLLMKALIAATGNIRRTCASTSDRGRPSTRSVTRWIAPVSVNPATTTNSAAIVSSASLPKADAASRAVGRFGDSRPSVMSTPAPAPRLTSGDAVLDASR